MYNLTAGKFLEKLQNSGSNRIVVLKYSVQKIVGCKRRRWIFAALVGLYYFSLVTLILFRNTILIIVRSITDFELVTQTYTKILVTWGEIHEITQNPREIKKILV